jgi:hypothetical protein
VYIIPAVVHIIHDDGPENVSYERIRRAIDEANKDLRLQNPDKSQITPEFRDIAADVGIELRLATRDPDGNPTKGITRTRSEYTIHEYPGGSGSELTSLIEWDHTRYLNIYVVRNIMSQGQQSNIAGYGFLPFMAQPGWDGIVVRYNYFGTGLSDRTLTHEIGHYLGLLHTFQGGCPRPHQECYNSSDRICDTPPSEEPNFGCNTALESCGSLVNVQNHMDYSSCGRMFTEGQADLMNGYMEQGIRSGLSTQQNLEFTGALRPISDFTSNDRVGCAGEQLTVNQLASNIRGNDITFEWHFEGGTPAVSSSPDPEVVYHEPGSYDVMLIVSNENGRDTMVREAFFDVRSPEYVNTLPFSENFSDPEFYRNGWQSIPYS